MPTIHVSQHVWKEIHKRQKDGEAPTDTLRRILDRDEEYLERKIEEKLRDLRQ